MNTPAPLPLAIVHGEAINNAPASLYIPPAALRIMLNQFEGPLDLLLFLVRKHKFDILNIPMALLCRQYVAYVEEIIDEDLELAADYLNMSALLVEIKTKMLLPRPPSEENDDENDPRADLVQRLLEYERIRQVAHEVSTLPRRERDFISPQVPVELPLSTEKPHVQSGQLAAALKAILLRNKSAIGTLQLVREIISVREVMSHLLRRLTSGLRLNFQTICLPAQGGVTFLALLQLALERLVHLQQEDNDELYIELRNKQS
ncbi:MAG: segregation/condensation protein A [Proteobacteria bacterium]|nr:segregation/condensation protein A [Pseudomonadota bacterium]